jgi:CheY-like chemotaxis protein
VEKTRQLERLINEAIDEARSLALDLSPPILQERGLAAGLEWLCRRLEEQHGLKVSLRAQAGVEPGTEDMKMFLFQAARELLLNVVNHAGVRQAQVTLEPRPPDYLCLTVKDEGAGFDASKVIVRSPTGFGLFNIQQRLELLGGGFEIRSTPGGGCEVSLTAAVPLHSSAPPPILTPRDQSGDLEHERANVAGQPIRVMIVDDHEILREGLANLLESNSQIEVVGAAGDGAIAVEEARKLRPDVILMDITMPTMNGIEATRSIKSEMPDCRIIALSMHEREDMEKAMREAGAIAYVSKDVPWDELNSVIQRIVTG